MMAVATPPNVTWEDRSLLKLVLPLSAALHVAGAALVPNVRRAPEPAPPPPIELVAPSPEAPSPPLPVEPPREEAAPRPKSVATHGPQPPQLPRDVPRSAPAELDAVAAPLDFTATAMSSETSLATRTLATGVPDGRGTAAPAANQEQARAPAAPVFVPAASLSRGPRAPGLDAALERNYPPEARRSGISGKAVLRVEVLADGRLGKVIPVSESFPGFGDACAKTVRAGRWEAPLDRQGRPVATEITYVCRFETRG